MNILAIETSCGKASVAIYSGKTTLAFAQTLENNTQAESLFALIDKVFAQTNLGYNQIDYLATTTGPGSFTGIRIGLSASKGIILAAKHITPCTFSNFEVMAFRALKQTANIETIIVALECSATTIYIQSFNCQLHALNDPQILNISELSLYLNSYSGTLAITGSGINITKDIILDKPSIILLPRYPEIDAKLVISLAAYKFRLKKPFNQDLAPLYIKQPSTRIN